MKELGCRSKVGRGIRSQTFQMVDHMNHDRRVPTKQKIKIIIKKVRDFVVGQKVVLICKWRVVHKTWWPRMDLHGNPNGRQRELPNAPSSSLLGFWSPLPQVFLFLKKKEKKKWANNFFVQSIFYTSRLIIYIGIKDLGSSFAMSSSKKIFHE